MAHSIADLEQNKIVAVRIVPSALAADSATLTDANIPPARNTTTGGTFNCSGLATVWVDVILTGGGSITLDPLIRDKDAADGAKWKRLLFGDIGSLAPERPVLDGSGFVEIRVDGGLIFPRIHDFATATAVTILARPGQPSISRGRVR